MDDSMTDSMRGAGPIRLALGVLRRPGAAFGALASAPRPRFGLGCGALLGLAWAAFAAALAAGGHAPSVDRGLPVPADRYYATAALYLLPLWIALTALTAGVAHGTARALGGDGRWPASLGAVGSAYALPLLAVFLLPDVIAWAVAGHGALGAVMRITGPAAVLLVTIRTVQAVRAVHGLGVGRALAAALIAAVVQAVPLGLLVR